MSCSSTTSLSTESFFQARERTRATGFNSIIRWIAIAKQMYRRQRQRQTFLQLEDHHLADIGLSRKQAEQKARKPFWK
jgi:uncharacterized protein YjiS (DUF1127 family)